MKWPFGWLYEGAELYYAGAAVSYVMSVATLTAGIVLLVASFGGDLRKYARNCSLWQALSRGCSPARIP